MNAHTQTNVVDATAILAPDRAAIRSHVDMIHKLAKGAGVDGILTFTRIDDKNNTHTERFSIGDVDRMADAIIGWSDNPNLNLYMSHVIFRKDLPKGAAGGEADVRAVLSLVGDLDSDIGKKAVALEGLPLPAPYVVETSAGNYHATFPLGRALTHNEAKPIAVKLCEAIGCDSGTKDTSHLWRIPGTLNWPSQTKLDRNRSAVPQLVTVKLAWTGETVEPEALLEAVKDAKPTIAPAITAAAVTLDWSKVAEHAGWLKDVDSLPQDFNFKGKIIVAHNGSISDLNFDLAQAGTVMEKPYGSWSEISHALAAIFKHHGGFSNEQIAAALMCDLPCNRHINKLPKDTDRRRAVERSLIRSHTPEPGKVRHVAGEPDWRERRENGRPLPSMHNARLAIKALGITCSHDTFHNSILFGYRDDKVKHELESIAGEVSDNGIIALRQLMSDKLSFDPKSETTRDAVISLAMENRFDPVCDMIDKAEAEWDGTKRLDRMAADYFNTEDTPLNSACIRKTMIAIVKRAREPGCKFDTITVLESKEGFNKSSAWLILAGAENFSDQAIIGKDAKEVQEGLGSIWVHESADLAGMRKADIEAVKAFASRTTDIARAAYGRFVTKQPRHSIEVGTTNDTEYLQSQTGNRRFWPMKVLKSIDIEKLTADRLQLIGEAARYQSAGESVVLDERLWEAAGIEQEKRRTKDLWEDVLDNLPDVIEFKEWKDGHHRDETIQLIHRSGEQDIVAASDLLEYVLRIPIAQQTTTIGRRLSNVMKQIGWERYDNGYVYIDGKRQKGYFRLPNADSPTAIEEVERLVAAGVTKF